MRRLFYLTAGLYTVVSLVALVLYPPFLYTLIVAVPFLVMGMMDILQTRQTIRRNFPVLGRMRYLMEMIRPEIVQYFIESNHDGKPFNREIRSLIYQRSKGDPDTLAFGTQLDVYSVGYEWINHSLAPAHPDFKMGRVKVGGPQCTQPYSASIFNISAMSYGALSAAAVQALNRGARIGGFAHNTGEGGLSPHHLEGGDLIWQIGTGYFGCRSRDGQFNLEKFTENAQKPQVKMIEIKLSQGAKPGHGGLLPAAKLTPEIAAIRGVVMGEDVVSPAGHTAFSTPMELLGFIQKLREASGGKPVGFKLCVGDQSEFLSIVKAMLHTRITPDFITVDGGEGGTGAAPVEFSDYVGTPLNEGLSFVHNALVGAGLRQQVRVIASGKVTTGFHLASKLALGADMCNSARGMMMALGCIQALRCNSNHCPTGVATQNQELAAGLHVPDKAQRVANFHRETVRNFYQVLGSAGLAAPNEISRGHIQRRVSSTEVRSYDEIYESIAPGALLNGKLPAAWSQAWGKARAESFKLDRRQEVA